MTGARVHDGENWIDIEPTAGHTGSVTPVPPKETGDGSIFVSLPSFRDAKRCAATIKSIFDNAKDPDKVIIGLIEQVAPEDDFCLSVYCAEFGVKNNKKQSIRKDMTKVIAEEGREKCPRYDQIRLVAVYNIAAKGPSDARALTRKILGNEEFCLQTDAHMVFTKDWDELVKDEWRMTGNEFGIISTVPANKEEQSDYESWSGSKKGEVPRQCLAKFTGNGVPEFDSPADGKAVNLEKPLMSHGWSAAFSFSKCHLEETAPYDPFTPYTVGIEQFGRFARYWTRGYDVYTPTRNIVYHDYSKAEHDASEWMKRRKERLRQESIARVKSFLHGPGVDDVTETTLANFGIYGLGKRRTLQQLEDFVGVKFAAQAGNRQDKKCGNLEWVPYDNSISPMENFYSKADDLDPQPEFPLRTEPTFYEQIIVQPQQNLGMGGDSAPEQKQDAQPSDTPVGTLFSLWIFGLIVWCVVFVNQGGGVGRVKKPRKRAKKGGSGYKDI